MNKGRIYSLIPVKLISVSIRMRSICLLFLLSLIVSAGYAYGDPYAEVINELTRMGNRINDSVDLVGFRQIVNFSAQ